MELSSGFNFKSINYKLYADYETDITKTTSDITVFALINQKSLNYTEL